MADSQEVQDLRHHLQSIQQDIADRHAAGKDTSDLAAERRQVIEDIKEARQNG